jgi:hypothetical protein
MDLTIDGNTHIEKALSGTLTRVLFIDFFDPRMPIKTTIKTPIKTLCPEQNR